MKKLVTLSLLLSTGAAQADGASYVNADGSPHSAACIAALEGAPLSVEDRQTLHCNGVPVAEFVRAHDEGRAPASPTPAARDRIVFRRGDDSMETELCLAAVTTGESVDGLKARFPVGDLENIEEDVLCNGMPLRSFVRKYGSRALTAAL